MSTGLPSAMRQSPTPHSTASTPERRAFSGRFVDLWWVTIPTKLRRYSILLWTAWSDGIYLTAWPRVATILVLAVFLFGFIEGGTHWRYRTIVGTNGFAGNVLAPMATANDWGGPTGLVFADNLLLLIIAVGLGSLSGNLGITLVLGYALGDILWAGPAPANLRFNDVFGVWICRYVPLIVSYLLFFLLASLPIVMAMELARSSHRRMNQSKAMTVGVTAIIEAALIYCWGGMAPMVFRTVQLWAGGEPRITVPFYMQITATWLVPIAILAVLMRALLFRLAAGKESFLARAQALTLRSKQTVVRTPPWAQAIIAAGLITLLMTGFLGLRKNWAESALFSNYLEGYVVFLGLAAALLLRTYFLPRTKRWQRWTEQVEQYPAVLRLGAATVATYVLTVLLMAIPGLQSTRPNEFGPEVTSILAGLGLILLLLPHGWLARPIGRRVMPWRRIPIPSGTTQAALIAAIILLATRKAFGDCNDCSCCFTGCLPGVAAAAAAGGIPGLGSIAGSPPPIGQKDPCATQEQGYKDAIKKEQQAQQNWNTADQALTQALTNQQAARTMAQQQWQIIEQLIPDAFGNVGEAELATLPADITQMTQDQFDRLIYWLQHTPPRTPNPNFAENSIVDPLIGLNADLGAADNAVQQATANVDSATAKLNDARADVAAAEKALSDCLGAHPHVHPLGAPPRPKY